MATIYFGIKMATINIVIITKIIPSCINSCINKSKESIKAFVKLHPHAVLSADRNYWKTYQNGFRGESLWAHLYYLYLLWLFIMERIPLANMKTTDFFFTSKMFKENSWNIL